MRVFQPAYANTYYGSYRLLALALFRRNSDCDRNARPQTADNFRALIIITADRLATRCLPTLQTQKFKITPIIMNYQRQP